MFRSKTLFILGAGSSHEVGLPTGESLKSMIAQKIDIRFEDGYKQNSGDYQITQAMREHAKKRDFLSSDINPYLRRAWQLRDALPQAISIDNLLDAHKDDQLAEVCGKFGIARSILEAEQSSKLFCSEYMQKIDFSKLTDTWFAGFVKILTEGVAKEQINEIFKNVSFINFNYLLDAIQNYYGLDINDVVPVMNSLKIIRPYGSVGKLPWQISNALQAVPYGLKSGNILEISKGIKTFNEQIEEEEKLKELRLLVKDAEIIVFLGFAFHKQNLELLRPGVASNAKRIYATALNISNSDCAIIKGEVKELLAQEERQAHIEINNRIRCNELFTEYWRGLTSGV
jgi:hypothetical protein